MDSERGSIPVFSPSDEVARSICEDYIKARSGQGITPGIAEPGLFFVDGEYKDKKDILVVHKELIDAARDRQRQWFINLVELADDEWNKYHLHRSISDMMRFAANFLGLEREWNVEAKADSIQFCPACKMTIQTGAIICGNCRTVIDKDAYKKAGFQPAGV
jgi:hypothetical protein